MPTFASPANPFSFFNCPLKLLLLHCASTKALIKPGEKTSKEKDGNELLWALTNMKSIPYGNIWKTQKWLECRKSATVQTSKWKCLWIFFYCFGMKPFFMNSFEQCNCNKGLKINFVIFPTDGAEVFTQIYKKMKRQIYPNFCLKQHISW